MCAGHSSSHTPAPSPALWCRGSAEALLGEVRPSWGRCLSAGGRGGAGARAPHASPGSLGGQAGGHGLAVVRQASPPLSLGESRQGEIPPRGCFRKRPQLPLGGSFRGAVRAHTFSEAHFPEPRIWGWLVLPAPTAAQGPSRAGRCSPDRRPPRPLCQELGGTLCSVIPHLPGAESSAGSTQVSGAREGLALSGPQTSAAGRRGAPGGGAHIVQMLFERRQATQMLP